jgi:nitrite reductase/ring-hydroxylating ferredoxin subunit
VNHRLAALTELRQLEPVLAVVDGRGVAVVRIEDEVYAFAATCTHRPGPLYKGAVTWKRTVLCPWHLGTFNLRTGKAMAGPPTDPLQTYPVDVVDGVVWLRGELPPPYEYSGHVVPSCALTELTGAAEPRRIGRT